MTDDELAEHEMNLLGPLCLAKRAGQALAIEVRRLRALPVIATCGACASSAVALRGLLAEIVAAEDEACAAGATGSERISSAWDAAREALAKEMKT